MEKVISVNEKIKRIYTQDGIVFLIAGVVGMICDLIPLDGMFEIISRSIHILLLLIALVLLFKLKKGRYEKFDEMADEHLNIAKAKARDLGIQVLAIVVILISVALIVLDYCNIKLPDYDLAGVLLNLTLAYMGINNYIVGRKFAALEEE